jgi:hypothetical protein
VLRLTANATITVAGNTTTSNIAHAADGADVVGAWITKLIWTTDARIDIKRGANTVVVIPPGTGTWDLREYAASITDDATATFVVTTAAAANCTLIVELTKRFA